MSRYAVGQIVTQLEILEIIKPLPQQVEKYQYRVRYLCCGTVGTVNHRRVNGRRASGAEFCAACAADLVRFQRGKIKTQGRDVKQQEDPVLTYEQLEQFPPPTWPRPASVPGGYWLWGSR